MAEDLQHALPKTVIRLRLRIVLLALALVALGISGYLALTSLIIGTPPVGCGGETGCGAVLSSAWATWFGVPVSLLAMGLYLAMFLALLGANAAEAKTRRIIWFILIAGSVTILASVFWFMILQLFVVEAICVYCTIDHAAGTLLAIGVLVLAWRTCIVPTAVGDQRCCITAMPWKGKLGGVGLGVVLALVMIGGQLIDPAPKAVRGDVAIDEDQDIRTGEAQRTLSLLGGTIKLEVSQLPHRGPVDAPQVMVFMFDYACPHCRDAHAYLPQLREEYSDQLLTVYMPTPLGTGCNPHVERIADFFERGCELARLSMAVWLADREQWPVYDKWLFDFPPKQPPSIEAARAQAERLVGAAALEEALADERVQAVIDRNIASYGEAHGGRLPVIMSPGAQPIIGRVYALEDLSGMLDGSSQ